MRNSGMGFTAIPIGAYREYFDIFGAPHSLSFFSEVIRQIDGRYLESKNEEQD